MLIRRCDAGVRRSFWIWPPWSLGWFQLFPINVFLASVITYGLLALERPLFMANMILFPCHQKGQTPPPPNCQELGFMSPNQESSWWGLLWYWSIVAGVPGGDSQPGAPSPVVKPPAPGTGVPWRPPVPIAWPFVGKLILQILYLGHQDRLPWKNDIF